jgi:hypothetical protein
MKSRQSKTNKCPPGKILRKSYHRKGHTRKSHKSGKKHVSGSFVSRTFVPASCVKDRGTPGKTPKSERVLPKIGKKISLRQYGYSVKKNQSKRHETLRKASKKEGHLNVLRHLNLVRNYQPQDKTGKSIKKKMTKDIEYLSQQYKKYKKKEGIN